MATVMGLNVKFAANTAGISKGAERTSQQLRGIQKSADKATSALRGLVALEIGKLFTSAVTSITGFIDNIRQSVGELTKLAQVANTSIERFQGLAVAAKTVGFEQDKLADIFKDVGDRVGDFLQTGGGPMADFFENIAPKVGVTAEQFARLSGPEALQLYVSSLEKAGLSQAEMTFYLEAMSSDLTALLPLLRDGGAGMNELADRAERLGITLSTTQIDAIKEMNGALSLVYDTFQGIIGQVTANLAPAITAIAEEFLQFVEGYKGLGEGTGGTALADSITIAFLDGASYLAGVFDYTIESLSGFGITMEDVANAFTTVGDVFFTVADVFYRAGQFFYGTFLQMQIALNAWLSHFLKGLATVAELIPGTGDAVQFLDAYAQNLDLLVEADREATNEVIENILNGLTRAAPQEAEKAAGGLATQFVDELRQRFEAMRAERAQRDVPGDQGENPLARAVEETDKNLEKIRQLNEQYAEKAEGIERERLDKLTRANQQALQAADIRDSGISQVLALATGREDPAIEAARAQQRELENISREIRKLGGTVELVGAA